MMSPSTTTPARAKKGTPLWPLVLVFLVGLAVLCYPLVSSWLNARAQSYVVNEFEAELAKLSHEELERQVILAQNYNAHLSDRTSLIRDPFSETPLPSGGVAYAQVLSISDIMGRVIIPKIDVDLPIYHGSSDLVLQEGIGHIEGSSMPVGGYSTHAILTGHRGLPNSRLFRDLGELQIGDLFYLRSAAGTLAYQVDQILRVLPYEIESLVIIPAQDYVTLITCDPYMINSHRILVRGHRVAYQGELDEDSTAQASPTQASAPASGLPTPLPPPAGTRPETTLSVWEKYREYWLALAVLVLLMLLVAFGTRRKRKKVRDGR